MKRLATLTLALAMMLAGNLSFTAEAQAFCGFYVSGASKPLRNSATQVIVMREGTTTVLSMRSNYQGPPEDFALVVPVPQLLKEENIKVLDGDVFDKVYGITAPQFFEYKQEYDCPRKTKAKPIVSPSKKHTKTISKFSTGEFNITVLSSQESNELEKWLQENGYNIPEGASEALAPYIASGMYFVVAKVNADKVKFDSKGNALLSPLRFHYNSDELSIPLQLGLLNADGPQDLVINIISGDSRYRAANYPNVRIPTDLIVPLSVKKDFDGFYEALFSDILKKKPGAVVTEYALNDTSHGTLYQLFLEAHELRALGADVITGVKEHLHVTVQRMDFTSSVPEYESFRQTVQSVVRKGANEKCFLPFIDQIVHDTQVEISLKLSLSGKGGHPTNIEFTNQNFGDQEFTSCITKNMEKLVTDRLPKPHTFTVKAKFKPRRVLTHSSSNSGIWNISRLHARYNTESLHDDLYLEKAADIFGGTKTLTERAGKIELHWIHETPINIFRGSYSATSPTKKPASCGKAKDPFYWWIRSPGVAPKAKIKDPLTPDKR